MKYQLIHSRELDKALLSRWSGIQKSEDYLASPYFRPEFTQAVGAVREDVWVCVLEANVGAIGFFPFHRGKGGVARPLGLGLSDHHGVIVGRETDWSATDLMRACGLVRWEFDHLLADQRQWQGWHRKLEASPIIETDQSFDAYEAKRNSINGKQLKDAYRCMRKLEREHGSHYFVAHSDDPAVFEAAIGWKRTQCQATGVIDYFAIPWTVELLRHLHRHQTAEFAGVLSAVFLKDTLIAVHFGMRSRTVLHFWFPSYNDQFGGYSPGSILLVELIRHACESEIEHIDLGKGMAPYKERFMTGSRMVADGCATRPSLVNKVHDLREWTERRAGESLLRPVFRWPGKLIKKLERYSRFR